MVAGDPADLDAVGGRDALLADLMPDEFFEVIGPKLTGPAARHVKAGKRHPAVEESHCMLLFGVLPIASEHSVRTSKLAPASRPMWRTRSANSTDSRSESVSRGPAASQSRKGR